MKPLALFLCLGTATTVLTGCSTGGAYQPKNTGKFNQEETSKFVLFDSGRNDLSPVLDYKPVAPTMAG